MTASASERLSEVLIRKGLTISVAESCTGGMIGKVITDHPGSSVYFKGSAVTYSDQAKTVFLNVPAGVMAAYGAVSPATARSMARGAALMFDSDLAVSVTGIAGPDGGSDDKPVGLVYIGISDGKTSEARGFMFEGGRGVVRRKATETALNMLADAAERFETV